jgi:hypothetical protein
MQLIRPWRTGAYFRCGARRRDYCLGPVQGIPPRGRTARRRLVAADALQRAVLPPRPNSGDEDGTRLLDIHTTRRPSPSRKAAIWSRNPRSSSPIDHCAHLTRSCGDDLGVIDRRGAFRRFAPTRMALREPPDRAANPNCRPSARSKMERIIPIENGGLRVGSEIARDGDRVSRRASARPNRRMSRTQAAASSAFAGWTESSRERFSSLQPAAHRSRAERASQSR